MCAVADICISTGGPDLVAGVERISKSNFRGFQTVKGAPDFCNALRWKGPVGLQALVRP